MCQKFLKFDKLKKKISVNELKKCHREFFKKKKLCFLKAKIILLFKTFLNKTLIFLKRFFFIFLRFYFCSLCPSFKNKKFNWWNKYSYFVILLFLLTLSWVCPQVSGYWVHVHAHRKSEFDSHSSGVGPWARPPALLSNHAASRGSKSGYSCVGRTK